MFDIDEQVDKLYGKLFTKYYNQWQNPLPSWSWVLVGPMKSGEIKAKIKSLLADGNRVKTGYMTTAIRGYPDRMIFYLKRTAQEPKRESVQQSVRTDQ